MKCDCCLTTISCFLRVQDPQERAQAEQILRVFGQTTEYIAHCKVQICLEKASLMLLCGFPTFSTSTDFVLLHRQSWITLGLAMHSSLPPLVSSEWSLSTPSGHSVHHTYLTAMTACLLLALAHLWMHRLTQLWCCAAVSL